jgi:hypothetical protein
MFKKKKNDSKASSYIDYFKYFKIIEIKVLRYLLKKYIFVKKK